MTSLDGHLRLVFAADARGTYIAEQSFRAPMHISKAYWDGVVLLVNVINPTAGIFGGDTICAHVTVESGARVLLTSPSAARFHPSQDRESRLEQIFIVRACASLDFFPEISIPQRDSRSFQKTTIEVEPGGELIYLETLAPGRVASGEAFAFARHAWSTDIRVGSRRVHRERVALTPEGGSLAPLRAFFPVSYYASLCVISPATEPWTADFACSISSIVDKSRLHIGASRLAAHGWSIRLLAADSVALHDGLHAARQLIYRWLGRPEPNARRNRI